jgi:protoporphyrinogen oxidase
MRELDIEIVKRTELHHIGRRFPQVKDTKGRYLFKIGTETFKVVSTATQRKAYAFRSDMFYPLPDWRIVSANPDPKPETLYLRRRICRNGYRNRAELMRSLNRALSTRTGDGTDEPYIQLINALYLNNE